MSEATLQAVTDAITAHIKDCHEHDDTVVINDWFLAYAGMRHFPQSCTGIGHFSGYIVNNEGSSPQASVGVATMGLEDLKKDLLEGGPCRCGENE